MAQDPDELLTRGRHVALLAELRSRCDYTSLKLLREIDAAAHDPVNPVRNPCLVLNDFNRNARKYRYGYGVGYGSGAGVGYGYGYGYGYGLDGDGSRKKPEDDQA